MSYFRYNAVLHTLPSNRTSWVLMVRPNTQHNLQVDFSVSGPLSALPMQAGSLRLPSEPRIYQHQ